MFSLGPSVWVGTDHIQGVSSLPPLNVSRNASQIHPEVPLLGESKFSQVNSGKEPSKHLNSRVCCVPWGKLLNLSGLHGSICKTLSFDTDQKMKLMEVTDFQHTVNTPGHP